MPTTVDLLPIIQTFYENSHVFTSSLDTHEPCFTALGVLNQTLQAGAIIVDPSIVDAVNATSDVAANSSTDYSNIGVFRTRTIPNTSVESELFKR